MNHETEMHPFLRRAILFLEEKDWGSADDYCERVLDSEPEHPYAYVIKLMARVRVDREEDIANAQKSFREWHSYKHAIRFADPELRARLEGYLSTVEENLKNAELKKLAEEEEKRQIEEAAHINGIYQKALRLQQSNAPSSVNDAISLYKEIIDYKDSRQKIAECEEFLAKEEERLRQRNLELEKKKIAEKKKKQISACIILAIVAIIIIFAVALKIDSNSEKAAEIEENLIGMVFSDSTGDEYLNYTYGSGNSSKRIVTTYTFNENYTYNSETVKHPAPSSITTIKPVIKTLKSNHGTWSDVTVSFGGDITVLVDDDICTLEVNSDNEPISITINGTMYK